MFLSTGQDSAWELDIIHTLSRFGPQIVPHASTQVAAAFRDSSAENPSISLCKTRKPMAQPSARLRRWPRVKGRLMQPVSALDYSSRLKIRSSRTSQSSKDTESTLGDDMYLGGELPEDPFMRGPPEILGRPRASSAPCRVYGKPYRRSYLERKPLPLVPPSSQPTHDAALVVTATTTTRASDFDEHDLEALRSEASSPFSDTTFHTCEFAEVESQERSSAVDIISFDDVPHGWHNNRSSMTCTEDGLWDEDTDCSNTPSDSPTINLPAQFAKLAKEELSPLSLIAASMAYERRTCFSLRRATSSPLLQARKPRVSKARKIISCPSESPVPESRPPSYAFGQETVPVYQK